MPLASLACCGTSLVGMPSRTPVPGSVTIFQPTLSCCLFAVSASDAALLRIEHAGRLAAAGFLEFLDRIDHALADVAGDRAVILADPGKVRLQRQPLGLRHRVGRVLRLLQRGTDRDRRDRFRLGARRGRRRHLRLRVRCRQNAEAAIINVAESTDLMTNPGKNAEWNRGAIIDVPPIKHICLVGNNCAPVQRGYRDPSS